MLIDGGRPRWRRVDIEAGVPIVEMMFQADHGSVRTYDDASPVLEPGGLGREIVDPIHRGARRHLEAVAQLNRTVRPTSVVTRPLLRLLTQPRPAEAGDIGRFPHSDALADDRNSHTLLPDAVRAGALIPNQQGRTLLRRCEWRPGLVALAASSPALRYASSHALGGLKVVGQLALRRDRRGAEDATVSRSRLADG
jgi:hypothetical protein